MKDVVVIKKPTRCGLTTLQTRIVFKDTESHRLYSKLVLHGILTVFNIMTVQMCLTNHRCSEKTRMVPV